MLGGSCSACCDNCTFANVVPQSIELDITGTGSGLYAAATYRDKTFIPGFGNIGDLITVAAGYYAREMQSGTYSLAFQSLIGNNRALFSHSDSVFSVSCVVGLNETALIVGPGAPGTGAHVLLEFSVVNTIAVSFVTGDANAVLQIKTESEMEDVLDDLIEFGETSETHMLRTATRPQQRELFFSPLMRARYLCLGRDSASVATFMSDMGGAVIHFSTDNTLFPFAFTQAKAHEILALTAGSFLLSLPFQQLYVEYGSFVGDWQVTTTTFGDNTLNNASFNVTRRVDVTECRAVFADGSTKRLPFG